jgi:hypothetical protein
VKRVKINYVLRLSDRSDTFPRMKNKAAVSLGRKGGSAKTPAQQQARANNLESARLKRWPKEKALRKAA